MFKLLYIYLYKYVSIFNKTKVSLVINNNKLLGCYYNSLNIPNISNYSLFKLKKKHILFLKKKFFFFRFLNRPLSLYKKIILHSKSMLDELNINTKTTNSFRSRLVRRCFQKIRSKRPVRNLYYKISRSRPLIRGVFPQIKRNGCVSDFIKNSENVSLHNPTLLNKYSPYINVKFRNPLLLGSLFINLPDITKYCGSKINKIRINGLLDTGKNRVSRYSKRTLTDSKKSGVLNEIDSSLITVKMRDMERFKKLRVRVSKVRSGVNNKLKFNKKYKGLRGVKKTVNKRKFGRNIPFFWYLFRAGVFNRLVKFFKIKKIFLTYFFWYKMTSLISKVHLLFFKSNEALFKSNKKVIVSSNLTGLDITKNINYYKLSYVNCTSLGSSVFNIYNIKTYNWLITI